MKKKPQEAKKTMAEVNIETAEAEKKGRIIVLAERVKLLFGFCSDLIPDLDLLKEVSRNSDDMISTVQGMTPILGAFGMDYEEKEFEARLRAKRSHALYELVKVLKETEDDRIEFKKSQSARESGRADIARMLGGL